MWFLPVELRRVGGLLIFTIGYHFDLLKMGIIIG
jgi:hypothetical protein